MARKTSLRISLRLGVMLVLALAVAVTVVALLFFDERRRASSATPEAPLASPTNLTELPSGEDSSAPMDGDPPSGVPRQISVTNRAADPEASTRHPLAPDAFLEGQVVDSEQAAISGAAIFATADSEPETRWYADSVGRFRIGPYPHGARMDLVVSAEGFRSHALPQ